MNYILIIICAIFSQGFSLQQRKPKLCINCKHFIRDNENPEQSHCALFPDENRKEFQEKKFYVTGIKMDEKKNNDDYYSCLTARSIERMCGKEGKMYKRKYNKKKMQ